MMKSFTMPVTKLLCSTLLLANSLIAESRLLTQWNGMPENPTPCLTADECREKFFSLNTGGYFYVIDRPYKGCMMKNANGYFAMGGTVEQMSTTYLPGIQERIWCGETWEEGDGSMSFGFGFEESMSLSPSEFKLDLELSMSMSAPGSISFGFEESMSMGPSEFTLDVELSMSMSMSAPIVDALSEQTDRVSLEI